MKEYNYLNQFTLSGQKQLSRIENCTFCVARLYMRIKLTLSAVKRKSELDLALSAIKKQAINYKDKGFLHSLVIFNIALYILLIEKDVEAIKVDALTHSDPWKRNLLTRVLLLTIFEWNIDAAANGRKLHSVFQEIKVDEELQKAFFDALREVRRVQQTAKKEFYNLRNSVIAHRDQDAMYQYNSIMDIDTKHVFEVCGRFYSAIGNLMKILPVVMMAVGSPHALFLQIVNRVNQ